MKLYQIHDEINHIYQLIEDAGGEITPELEAQLDSLEIAKTEKCENVLMLIQSLEGYCQTVKREYDRLKGIQKKVEKELDGLEKYMLHVLGKDAKLQTKIGTISFRKSEACECVNEDLVPDAYKRETIVVKPNISMAKQTIKEGGEVPGFTLKTNYNLQVK